MTPFDCQKRCETTSARNNELQQDFQRLRETIDELLSDKAAMQRKMQSERQDMEKKKARMDTERKKLTEEMMRYQILIDVVKKASETSEERSVLAFVIE